MILSILFFPKIKIKKFTISTYWVISLIGALLLIITKQIGLNNLFSELTSNSSMNPIKILVLFLSMTVLSIYLDEVGLFKYIANYTIKKAQHNQFKLFVYLYVLVSILTVFTSNDIIILTFTPFICYFAKNTKINPIPFLVTEFVAANTWSLMFLIGNPTNIYIGAKFNIDFISYLKVMFVPTIIIGLTSFFMLLLIFRKALTKPIKQMIIENVSLNKKLLLIGLIHLCSCTLLLIISSYFNIEMWIITLCFALSLLLCIIIYKLIAKAKNVYLTHTLQRLPYELIPFVLSMFTIVLSLKENNITFDINHLLDNNHSYTSYIISSFLCTNLLNNIPTSVLYSEILVASSISIKNIFGVIMCSNLGAILTPIGALAGIMWMSLLKDNGVKFSFKDFVKYGSEIIIPTLIIGSLCLYII